ncbi:MAG: S8 family serine peptidase, partial [Clostridiales bacterium]|nr:S8 family serine peptidase [Clostridiales bacterium]
NRTPEYEDDQIAEFSSRGPARGRQVKPDVVAPGVGITAARTNKEYTGGLRRDNMKELYTKMSGTSVATPVVAGAAALMFSKDSNMSPSAIKEVLMESAFNMSNVSKYAQGSGILNIRACMNLK